MAIGFHFIQINLYSIQLSHIALVLSRKSVRQKRTESDRKSIKTSHRMHIFVARVRFFALLDEHFLLSFLTNAPFVCIMEKKQEKKGEQQMYGEVVRVIMRSQMIDMISCFSLAILVPVIYLVFFHIPFKKKKMSKKKKNQKKKEMKEALTGATALSVCLLLLGCIALGEYLALRQDFVTDNYTTYTGEFRYYLGGRNNKRRIQWVDENGKKTTVTYRRDVRKFYSDETILEKGYYEGTVVYSHSSEYLLWWDAERIGE